MAARNKRSTAVAEVVAGEVLPALPAATTPVLPTLAGSFTDNIDGSVKASFNQYRVAFSPLAPLQSMMGAVATRDAHVAAAVATDLSLGNPTVAAIVETVVTYGIGTGLTLSSKPDFEALGITAEEADDLSHQIETRWAEYASDPRSCDWVARKNLHELATAHYRVCMLTGEGLTVYGWKKHPGSKWRSKVNLLSPGQLAVDVTRVEDKYNAMTGVCFNDAGTLVGYMIRSFPLGSLVFNAQPKFMPTHTSWGRRVVLHVFESLDARQLRGISPLVAALAPAQDRQFLGEKVLGAAALQASYALTIESDSRPEDLANSMAAAPDVSEFKRWLADRQEYYSATKIDFTGPKVNFLSRGDKLKFNQAGAPNETFQDFDKSLTRQSARAAGTTFEDVSGDYSGTNFAASRMANFIPGLLNQKRRKLYIEQFYEAAFCNWLEEAIAIGVVVPPKHAAPFWTCREAFCRASWLGVPPPEPDRKKAADAIVKELENGLITLTDACAARGIDFDTQLATLSREVKQLEESGLIHPMKLAAIKAQSKKGN